MNTKTLVDGFVGWYRDYKTSLGFLEMELDNGVYENVEWNQDVVYDESAKATIIKAFPGYKFTHIDPLRKCICVTVEV